MNRAAILKDFIVHYLIIFTALLNCLFSLSFRCTMTAVYCPKLIYGIMHPRKPSQLLDRLNIILVTLWVSNNELGGPLVHNQKAHFQLTGIAWSKVE